VCGGRTETEEILCEKKLKLLFLLSAFLSFSSLFSSPLTESGSTSLQSAELSLPDLPVFPVAGNLLTIPAPTPTGKSETLNERTARQLEAWIAYYGTVKDYVSRVNSWSAMVSDSWEKVKVSSTNYEAATQEQIKERDAEIVKLHGDVIKYAAGGFLLGAGLIVGLMAR
jgi:hypothetical protein